jgi:hypothetical protein
MTWAAAALLPALLVSTLTIGCGSDNKTEAPKDSDSKKVSKKDKDKKGQKREELASTGWGTLKGRVTLKGSPPNLDAMTKELQDAMKAKTDDTNACIDTAPADQKDQQKWRIGKNQGVGNVFVWLEPPKGKYFKVDMAKKTWEDTVTIHQPHCAFIPHATVVFPGTYDPANPDELKPSGQKFVVKNDAKINHNTALLGGPENQIPNRLIPAGKDMPVELKVDGEPIMVRCDIHKWMNGVIRVFAHPYAAVTNNDGEYEIKNVPAGAELSIMVWHEEAGYGGKGKEGDKVTLKDGDNTKDYTIEAK